MIQQTFAQFLESVAQTKRQNITHLEQMKPVEFAKFARQILARAGGKLKDVPVFLKVDGFGARFGRDANGKFFFETSRSGSIQSSGAFSAYNRDRGVTDDVLIKRAKHYDDVYEKLKSSPIWYHLPIDSKVTCEILYNPMATLTDDGLKFVSVRYDKNKLGEVMTVVPFAVIRASSGESLKDADAILKAMEALSNKEIKVVNPELGSIDLNVSATLKPMSLFTDEMIEILQSRKRADKEKKIEYEAIIQEVKNSLAKQILNFPVKEKDKLGDEIEGFVIRLGDKQYKITTQDFKNSKKKPTLNEFLGGHPILINEIFDSQIPVRWKQISPNEVYGYFDVDESSYRIFIQAGTYSFEGRTYSFLNCGFAVMKGEDPDMSLQGGTKNPSKVLGAVYNGIRQKVEEFDADALVFTATDNVERRMPLYGFLVSRFNKSGFPRWSENIKTRNGAAHALYSKNMPDGAISSFKKFVATK